MPIGTHRKTVTKEKQFLHVFYAVDTVYTLKHGCGLPVSKPLMALNAPPFPRACPARAASGQTFHPQTQLAAGACSPSGVTFALVAVSRFWKARCWFGRPIGWENCFSLKKTLLAYMLCLTNGVLGWFAVLGLAGDIVPSFPCSPCHSKHGLGSIPWCAACDSIVSKFNAKVRPGLKGRRHNYIQKQKATTETV